MMRIGDVRDAVLRAQLRRAGVRLQVAGLSINLRTDVMAAARLFLEMYRGHRIEPGPGVDDFRVFLTYTGPLRRFLRRRTQIHIDGAAAFEPPPYRHAYLAIESALNACISATATHAVVHAAMVERDGLGTLLKAHAGSAGRRCSVLTVISAGARAATRTADTN